MSLGKKLYKEVVALFTGAWIEILSILAQSSISRGRALYGRVD